MINGERIKQAREIKGITQTELAERVNVAQAAIAMLEQNAFQPSDELVHLISIQIGFPPSFFSQDSGPEFPLGSLLYRKRNALKSQDRTTLNQLGRLTYEIADKMAKKFKPIELRLSKVKEDPITAARVTRTQLGLSPDTPVRSLIKTLEKNGVIVLAVPYTLDEFDAFSLWADTEPRRPVIILTGDKPGDRQRFSVSHELGHLILHQSFHGNLTEIEDEADRFASEFLMPEETIRKEISLPVTLTDLAELKARWGVSIQALIMKAFDLEMITDRQRRYLFQKLSVMWGRKTEPVPIPTEKPRGLRRLAELLYGEPINYSKVAKLVSAPPEMIKRIMELHADKSSVVSTISKGSRNEDNILPFSGRR